MVGWFVMVDAENSGVVVVGKKPLDCSPELANVVAPPLKNGAVVAGNKPLDCSPELANVVVGNAPPLGPVARPTVVAPKLEPNKRIQNTHNAARTRGDAAEC